MTVYTPLPTLPLMMNRSIGTQRPASLHQQPPMDVAALPDALWHKVVRVEHLIEELEQATVRSWSDVEALERCLTDLVEQAAELLTNMDPGDEFDLTPLKQRFKRARKKARTAFFCMIRP